MSEPKDSLDPIRDASREMERLLLDVLGSMPGTAITVFDRRLHVLLMSGAAPFDMGIDPAFATGRPLSELMSSADYVRLEPTYRATLAGESRTDEQSMLGAEGVWWLRTVPLKTSSGTVYAGLSVATDVTDRRVEELRRLRIDAQLERARRLEAVGKMAGGVAHDFNNLLAVVLNYSDFIADALPGDSELQQDLAEIRRAGERGASLTRQLLIFSRREVARPEAINLNEILSNLEKLVTRTLGEQIELTIGLADGLPMIEADPAQIEQALVGMALNARDAMPEGGSLTIQTEDVDLDLDYVDMNPQAQTGRHVRITIADTGHGISPGADRAHLRAVLHHEVTHRGDRPRPGSRPWRHGQRLGAHRRVLRAGPRCRFPPALSDGGRPVRKGASSRRRGSGRRATDLAGHASPSGRR